MITFRLSIKKQIMTFNFLEVLKKFVGYVKKQSESKNDKNELLYRLTYSKLPCVAFIKSREKCNEKESKNFGSGTQSRH